ncbi:MAG: hypothetical protein ABI880_13280, partial [Acidobacteriota bacterium]
GPALAHFDLACARYGQDVALLLAAAWLEERTAVAPLLATELLAKRTLAASAGEKTSYLERARGRLERAGRADPVNAEVTLRWAHVQLALGDARDARRRLDDLLRRLPPLDLATAYLAHVFLAQALLALDDASGAAASFATAIALLPEVQTAQLGLLSAQAAGGAVPRPTAESLDWLRDETDPNVVDPWIDYLVGRLTQGPPLRQRLREEVQR